MGDSLSCHMGPSLWELSFLNGVVNPKACVSIGRAKCVQVVRAIRFEKAHHLGVFPNHLFDLHCEKLFVYTL